MARNSGKKMSRRELIAVVGSGVVVAGTSLRAKGTPEARASASSSQPSKAARDAECAQCPESTVTEAKGTKSTVLVSDFCCCDCMELIDHGYNGSIARAKKNLRSMYQAMEDKNQNDELLEYCVLIAGITEMQGKEIAQELTRKFNLAKAKLKK